MDLYHRPLNKLLTEFIHMISSIPLYNKKNVYKFQIYPHFVDNNLQTVDNFVDIPLHTRVFHIYTTSFFCKSGKTAVDNFKFSGISSKDLTEKPNVWNKGMLLG